MRSQILKAHGLQLAEKKIFKVGTFEPNLNLFACAFNFFLGSNCQTALLTLLPTTKIVRRQILKPIEAQMAEKKIFKIGTFEPNLTKVSLILLTSGFDQRG